MSIKVLQKYSTKTKSMQDLTMTTNEDGWLAVQLHGSAPGEFPNLLLHNDDILLALSGAEAEVPPVDLPATEKNLPASLPASMRRQDKGEINQLPATPKEIGLLASQKEMKWRAPQNQFICQKAIEAGCSTNISHSFCYAMIV